MPFPLELGRALYDSVHVRQEDSKMKPAFRSGASIAAAAATLILAGAITAPAAHAAEEGKGHCVSANACKGQGACASAANACKGQNACKGKGYLIMTQEECSKIEGATFEPAEG
jgi:hypothetical protein